MATVASNQFDAIIIGAGGSGMRACLQLARSGYRVALLSKVFPTRSHTVSAQGGITAALGNMDEDDWRWHMYDTVKGSDYLGDQDCIEYLCKNGPEVVYELEHMGLPFSRIDSGKIYQRPFGGQSKNYGGDQASRTCAAADRTGHALLHALYQQNIKANAHIYSEWFALDLVMGENGQVAGVIAMCIETGECVFFHSRITILATGGAGRIFQSTTNARICTGDGFGMVLRAGLPLQDMEMWQFHPTGIAGVGCLVTEGARGEGGYLINKNGERFMERYAPSARDLASRDVVARAMTQEIREGRGFAPDGVDHVKLKLDHLGKDILDSRLPGICELSRTFAHVDPVNEPIPVVPTCHYAMGGIPTNINGQVLTQNEVGQEVIVPGLYAAGECACVSVHGANRLGGNSLLDLVVFGRAVGRHVNDALRDGVTMPQVSQDAIDKGMQRYHHWMDSSEGESYVPVREEMQRYMQEDFSVFREEKSMTDGLEKLQQCATRLEHAYLPDKSRVFNTSFIEALEMDNLLLTAISTAHSALSRRESRGAHSREDYPDRNDAEYLHHTLYFPETHEIKKRDVNLKPLTMKTFEPVERVY